MGPRRSLNVKETPPRHSSQPQLSNFYSFRSQLTLQFAEQLSKPPNVG